jgi:hypothetical protein
MVDKEGPAGKEWRKPNSSRDADGRNWDVDGTKRVTRREAFERG